MITMIHQSSVIPGTFLPLYNSTLIITEVGGTLMIIGRFRLSRNVFETVFHIFSCFLTLNRGKIHYYESCVVSHIFCHSQPYKLFLCTPNDYRTFKKSSRNVLDTFVNIFRFLTLNRSQKNTIHPLSASPSLIIIMAYIHERPIKCSGVTPYYFSRLYGF